MTEHTHKTLCRRRTILLGHNRMVKTVNQIPRTNEIWRPMVLWPLTARYRKASGCRPECLMASPAESGIVAAARATSNHVTTWCRIVMKLWSDSATFLRKRERERMCESVCNFLKTRLFWSTTFFSFLILMMIRKQKRVFLKFYVLQSNTNIINLINCAVFNNRCHMTGYFLIKSTYISIPTEKCTFLIFTCHKNQHLMCVSIDNKNIIRRYYWF